MDLTQVAFRSFLKDFQSHNTKFDLRIMGKKNPRAVKIPVKAKKMLEIEDSEKAEKMSEIENSEKAEKMSAIENSEKAEKMSAIENSEKAEETSEIEDSEKAEETFEIEDSEKAEKVPEIEDSKKAEKLPEIEYSEKYLDDDDIYEYRHVTLPPHVAKLIPRDGILTEIEWRAIGVCQSRGWEHYAIHPPEPHILLFRRPLNYQQILEQEARQN